MTGVLTPLELSGWLDFNAWRTGLEAHRFVSATPGEPEIRAVFYLDARGRIWLPPNNPYLPIVFHSARQRPSGRTAEWLRAVTPLVNEMKRRTVVNYVSLPPDVIDVRPWRWCGFIVGVGYSYYLDFPIAAERMERAARRNSEKASKLGMTVDRVTQVAPVLECLAETEERKGFSHHIGQSELGKVRELLGDDSLRMYVCFDGQGRAVATKVVLHAPGARAVAWIGGAKTDHLADGSNYLLWLRSIEDLAQAGATGIDMFGADLEPVASFKSQWGGRLVPTYSVRTYSLRAAARFVLDWRHSGRRPRRT